MAKHARYSPSKLEGLEQCPCFEYKEDPPSTDDGEETPAERGTRLHKAVETRDLNLCDDDMERGQVQMCIDYQDSIVATAGPGAEIRTELRVRVRDLTYGTLDFAVLNKDRTEAWLMDWKFIRTPSISSAKVNLQIACYLAGLMHRFKRLKAAHGNLLAPALGSVSEPVTIVRETMPAIEERIVKVIESANDPFKQPRACDMCSKCANARRCPALNGTAVAAARGIGLPVPSTFSAELAVDPLDRAKAQVMATALENWAEQVKKHNNEFARAGGEVPGHIVARRAGNISVKAGAAPIERLQEAGLLNYSDIFSCCKLRIPDAVTKVMETTGKTKEEARELVLDTLGELASRSEDIVYLQRQRSISAEEVLKLGESNA